MQRKTSFVAIAVAIAMVGCDPGLEAQSSGAPNPGPEMDAPAAVSSTPAPDVADKAATAGEAPALKAETVTADAPAPPPPPRPAEERRRSLSGKKADAKARPQMDLGVSASDLGALGTRGRGAIGNGVGYGAGVGGLGSAVSGAKDRTRLSRRMPARRTPRRPSTPVVAQPAPEPVLGNSKLVDHGVNGWTYPSEDRHSTFAADVDSGSYTFARRFMARGRLPAPAGVRVEEWINAFSYDYEGPDGDAPFAVHLAEAPSPINTEARIVRVGIQGKRVSKHDRKPAHITFLVDVSGSMTSSDKLPQAQRAMKVLVDNLDGRDSVAIATYAGRHALVLPATTATRAGKRKIRRAIDQLRSGGGTNMGDGMTLAYREANKHLSSARMSRVVVLSDGDANIGRVRYQDILATVRGYVSEGVTLSTVGFGTGNYNDHLMEQLANAGNGNYSYIDSDKTARRVFGDQLVSTLQVIAQDVKIQVEFDPAQVERYRLIGYENRDVADRDFRNDKVDAGEIGAGHTVTALYEVVPKAKLEPSFATVRLRYKKPRHSKASELTYAVSGRDMQASFGRLDPNTRFAVGVALAAEIMRGSPHAAGQGLDDALRIVRDASTGEFRRERRDFAGLLEGLTKRDLLTRR